MTHIQQRRGLASEWLAENPILLEGEAGHETDTGKWKLGDGVTAWASLPYKQNVDSVSGKTGAVVLEVADVDGAAPLDSPALTGNPTAPTPAASDNDTSIATTAYVKANRTELVGSAGTPLDTLGGLATSIGNDPDFIGTMVDALDTKAPLNSPTFTGNPTAPTPAIEDDDTSIATTAFVKDAVAAILSQMGVWTAYTPTVFPWTVHATNKFFRYHVFGKTIKIQSVFAVASVPTTEFLEIGLPTDVVGFTGGLSQYRAVGTWHGLRTGVIRHSGVALLGPDGTKLYFAVDASGGLIDHDNPVVWFPDDVITFEVEFEIL